MRTQTIHPKGYGAPMRALFALAVYYSGQDATVSSHTTAPFLHIAYMDPYSSESEMDPFRDTAYMDPHNVVGEM